ncbi:MAG: hypothetical protein LBL33_00140 [Tannerella sp.]|jgi:hypothetical protein|nr:hypothetical protein [Tannerella sp.]
MKNTFFFKGWEEIYTTDSERKMPYQQANEFGERMIEIYEYNIIEVPLVSGEKHTVFILNKIRKLFYRQIQYKKSIIPTSSGEQELRRIDK